MYELTPLLQIRRNANRLHADLLLEGLSLEVETDAMLRMIELIATNSPASLDAIKRLLVEQNVYDHEQAEIEIQKFLEARVLVRSDQITSQKHGVQFWADHGWIDALILHLNTRDIVYQDDPVDVGGRDDQQTIFGLPDNLRESVSSELNRVSWKLPHPRRLGPDDVLRGMMTRRSFQPYRGRFSIEKLSSILWHANSYARQSRDAYERADTREGAYDSAFSCLTTYMIVYQDIVDGENVYNAGIYQYDISSHRLIGVKMGEFRDQIAEIAIGQKRASAGLFTFLIAGNWEKYRQRYPHGRSYRNLLVNVAEQAQYYLVLATAYEYATFMTPAMQDERMQSLIESFDHLPLYFVTAG
ncbi:hypothetical protein IY145_00545 [Methylosinus sp. H3A]|uniref:hypothetical protein n=1 Tax=Methylosinus sp. H3A TaxID=2785786 RepID=UPI0018C3512A|nr:hypothetical protein [Methylosinus sp. H3A]MBG0807921.1 hypothetical protein [Methylosinus sp. H3A]